MNYGLGTITSSIPTNHAIIWLIATLHLIGFTYVVFDCLRHRREADSALLWIFISWSLTLVGSILYLYFGIDRVPSPQHRKAKRDQELDDERTACTPEELPKAYWRPADDATRTLPDTELGLAITRGMTTLVPHHPLMAGNTLHPLISGDEAYPAMLAAIREARHHIHLESFIIGADKTGTEFLDLLKQKAGEGVEVRLLYDRFGSTHAVLNGLFKRYKRVKNMKIIGFSQANLLKRQFGINLRNHRKILVIDGTTAFTGGTNLAIENTTHDGEAPIHDYHFHVDGPIVQELQYTFLQDWHSMTCEEPKSLLKPVYFPEINSDGTAKAQLINSGPTSPVDPISEAMFLAVTQSQREILAVTPYFVPTADLLHAFASAAARGVNVRLVLPRDNNHFYAGLASCALYEELLKNNVEIYEKVPPFSHAKALVVDGYYSIVGSANLDVRSLRLNYETCLGVYDEAFASQLQQQIAADIANSERVELAQWLQRPFHRKLLENASSLLTPML